VRPGDSREAEQSAVLHRLGVARIPYARERESGLGGGGRTGQAGALQQLGRVREKWELCWRPAVDAALIERSAWGSTLGEVCARLLGEQIERAGRVDEASEVVMRLALCDLSDGDRFVAALARCQTLAADSL